MTQKLSDGRVKSCTKLVTPRELEAEFPVSERAARTVLNTREALEGILDGDDQRKFVVVGPCSIHDPEQALEFAEGIKPTANKVKDKIVVVMRAYLEKPRSSPDWRGYILDPDLDDTGKVNKGFRTARKLLLDLGELGIPVGTEALYPHVPRRLGDLVSWTSIGARSTQNPAHKEMASALSTPVGFKNTTSGDIREAILAIKHGQASYSFLGEDYDGVSCIVNGTGNPYCHIILRGGTNGTNYDEQSIAAVVEAKEKEGLKPRIVIDCSHGNSGKDYRMQRVVFRYVLKHFLSKGNRNVLGLMMEANIKEGNQKLDIRNPGNLERGRSITDSCDSLSTAKGLLEEAYEVLPSPKSS